MVKKGQVIIDIHDYEYLLKRVDLLTEELKEASKSFAVLVGTKENRAIFIKSNEELNPILRELRTKYQVLNELTKELDKLKQITYKPWYKLLIWRIKNKPPQKQ